MSCCKRDDLFVIKDGKWVQYIPPTEKFRSKGLNVNLDIGKALDLIGSWGMDETEWNLEQIEYYLENIATANMKMVKNPKYSEPNKVLMEIGPFNYDYPDLLDAKKLSTPGILLPKELIGASHDVVVDGNHRLIKCYREKRPMRMKILTKEQYKEISIDPIN